VQKLFKGGNYSRAETIRENTVCTFYLVGKLAIKGGTTQRRSHVLYVLLYELYQCIMKVKPLKRFLPKYTRDQNVWQGWPAYELECLGHGGQE
jgi:hypothetical protein